MVSISSFGGYIPPSGPTGGVPKDQGNATIKQGGEDLEAFLGFLKKKPKPQPPTKPHPGAR